VVREPLAILDENLTVLKVNQAFRELFKVNDGETEGRRIYELGSGQWNDRRLRVLLDDVLPNHNSFDDYEVEQTFPGGIGTRTMALSGKRIERGHEQNALILLSVRDVTPVSRGDGDSRRRRPADAAGGDGGPSGN